MECLAHELGHAMADDVQRDNQHSFRDFSTGEMEEQAYFVQHIVSQHLKDNFKQPDIQDDNLGQNVLTMSWDRENQYTNAGRVFETALENTGSARKGIALKALDQRLG